MALLAIDRETCTKDAVCVAECPARIIEMDPGDGYPAPVSDFGGRCLGCGHCVAVCPTGALSLDWLSPEDCPPLQAQFTVTPEQAEQFLRGRRSIRTYKEKTVPRNVLDKLLDVACSAPSAKNRQPWHWVVVEEPAKVQHLAGLVIDWMRVFSQRRPELAETLGFNRAVSSWDQGYDRICRGAPHLLVVHAEKDWAFGPEDCTLALSLLDLYATSIGLGACWAGYFYKAVNAYPPLFEALGLPHDHLAFGALMLGYPRFTYLRIPLRNPPRVSWI